MSNKGKLSGIKDEKAELHPLLKMFLKKMPNVIDVEYTHAQGEMGADFVISKEHSELRHIEYVGVIAKIGKIHQDFSEIERQIKECDVPRKFRGGREEIRINEIWVVITENITRSAQEKIHEMYKNRKIEFIYGDKLCDLIDKYCPEIWTGLNPEVSEYLVSIKNKNEEMERSFSLLPTNKRIIYIEPEIVKKEYDDYSMKTKRKSNIHIEIHSEISKNKIVYVEGSMGAGKSKLLRRLVDYYSEPSIFSQNSILPIFTTYKVLLDEYDLNIGNFISAATGGKLSSIGDIKNYLVLIDAIDEKNIATEELRYSGKTEPDIGLN